MNTRHCKGGFFEFLILIDYLQVLPQSIDDKQVTPGGRFPLMLYQRWYHKRKEWYALCVKSSTLDQFIHQRMLGGGNRSDVKNFLLGVKSSCFGKARGVPADCPTLHGQDNHDPCHQSAGEAHRHSEREHGVQIAVFHRLHSIRIAGHEYDATRDEAEGCDELTGRPRRQVGCRWR